MFVYICIAVGDPTGLTLPRLCACPKPGFGFPTSYVLVFYAQWVDARGDCSLCWSIKDYTIQLNEIDVINIITMFGIS